MAFRDDREAMRARITALEDQLVAAERELAESRTESQNAEQLESLVAQLQAQVEEERSRRGPGLLHRWFRSVRSSQSASTQDYPHDDPAKELGKFLLAFAIFVVAVGPIVWNLLFSKPTDGASNAVLIDRGSTATDRAPDGPRAPRFAPLSWRALVASADGDSPVNAEQTCEIHVVDGDRDELCSVTVRCPGDPFPTAMGAACAVHGGELAGVSEVWHTRSVAPGVSLDEELPITLDVSAGAGRLGSAELRFRANDSEMP